MTMHQIPFLATIFRALYLLRTASLSITIILETQLFHLHRKSSIVFTYTSCIFCCSQQYKTLDNLISYCRCKCARTCSTDGQLRRETTVCATARIIRPCATSSEYLLTPTMKHRTQVYPFCSTSSHSNERPFGRTDVHRCFITGPVHTEPMHFPTQYKQRNILSAWRRHSMGYFFHFFSKQ